MANPTNQPQKPVDKKQSTQAHLPIAEIRNSTVVLKDGSLRLILIVSTINFDLKNKQEQDALTYGFQDFINSLDFPIQIVMQSRKIDLSVYLTRLRARLGQIENPLLQIQTEDYIAFVEKLISVANIMNKRFYVVIPFFPPILKKSTGFVEKLKLTLTSKEPVVDMTHFEEYRKQLVQRAQAVASGLGALGLRAIQLSTQELIELLYQTYNPELAIREKLIPIGELSGPVTRVMPKSEIQKEAESDQLVRAEPIQPAKTQAPKTPQAQTPKTPPAKTQTPPTTQPPASQPPTPPAKTPPAKTPAANNPPTPQAPSGGQK